MACLNGCLIQTCHRTNAKITITNHHRQMEEVCQQTKAIGKMTAIDIEKTMLLHLMACNVPESAIQTRRAKDRDIVTVSVHAPHGTKVRDYSVFQLINGKPYVVNEMCELALWYHGPEPISARQTFWDYIAGCWMATPQFMRVGLTLVVIVLIAKLAGLYK